jgi:hypothetical protein
VAKRLHKFAVVALRARLFIQKRKGRSRSDRPFLKNQNCAESFCLRRLENFQIRGATERANESYLLYGEFASEESNKVDGNFTATQFIQPLVLYTFACQQASQTQTHRPSSSPSRLRLAAIDMTACVHEY